MSSGFTLHGEQGSAQVVDLDLDRQKDAYRCSTVRAEKALNDSGGAVDDMT